MPLLPSAIFWLVLAAALTGSQLRQGRPLSAQVVGLAVLGAGLILAAGSLSQTQAGPLGTFLRWLSRFLLYLSLMPLFTKLPWRRTVTSGLVFSSSMTLLELLGLIA
jgi:hypothetical protein